MKSIFTLKVAFAEKSGIECVEKTWINPVTASQSSVNILKDLKEDLYKHQFCYTERCTVSDILDGAIMFIKQSHSHGYDLGLNISNPLCFIEFKKSEIDYDKMKWIPCSERIPTESDCGDTNVFIVTIKRQRSEDSKPLYYIDEALIDSAFENWLLRKETETVVAWLPQIEPYIPKDE